MPGGVGARSASEAKELAEEEVYDAVVGFAAAKPRRQTYAVASRLA